MNPLSDWIDVHQDLIVDVHQKAWDWAEVGLKEFQTGKLLADILEENGFTVERGVAGMPTAFVATYGSGAPVIGVMAELDALPDLSQKAVPYREPAVEGGAGHGCGHCSYAATAFGAALAVKASLRASLLQVASNSLTVSRRCILGCKVSSTSWHKFLTG